MTRSNTASRLASQFDSFLFAPIGEEGNGMPLSVLSALARRNVDPWQEAAALTQLPEETATQRLIALITPLPSGLSLHRDPTTLAAYLLALLPRSAASNAQPRKTVLGIAIPGHFRTVMSMIVINAIFMAFLFGAQSIMADHQSPSPAAKDPASDASAIAPQIKSPVPEPQ